MRERSLLLLCIHNPRWVSINRCCLTEWEPLFLCVCVPFSSQNTLNKCLSSVYYYYWNKKQFAVCFKFVQIFVVSLSSINSITAIDKKCTIHFFVSFSLVHPVLQSTTCTIWRKITACTAIWRKITKTVLLATWLVFVTFSLVHPVLYVQFVKSAPLPFGVKSTFNSVHFKFKLAIVCHLAEYGIVKSAIWRKTTKTN